MVAGLLCSIHIQSRKWRTVAYGAVFISIAGKCLCGYEYITVIMMSSILFLLSDLLMQLMKKEKKQVLLLPRTIFFMGCVALLGFAFAICIHAGIRGNGNLVEGIKDIILQDVLRRTLGGNINEFSSIY